MFKFYALLALLPIIFVFLKINKREALNCLDILLVFHSLYFAAIPLMGNEELVRYQEVVKDGYVQFFAFAYYILFAIVLLIIDMYISKKGKGDGLLYLGDYIKTLSEKYNFTGKVAYVVMLISVVLITYSIVYFMTRTLSVSGMSFDEKFNAVQKSQTPLVIFFYGLTKTLRTFATFLIAISYVQANRLNVSLGKKWHLVAFLLAFNYLLINRTALFQGITIIALVVYSVNRQTINAKTVMKILAILVLAIAIIFPLITAYRSTSKRLMGSAHSSVDVIIPSLLAVVNGEVDMQKADNKDSRSLGVFNIFAKSTNFDKNYNGELTLHSVSHGIPKYLYPGKSSDSSQSIIEGAIGNNVDVADSILLHFQMENKHLGFLLSNLFFLFLIFIYDKMNNIFYQYTHEEFLLIIFISQLYPWLNQIEYGFDTFTTGIFSAILLGVVCTFVMKFIRFLIYSFENKY